MLGFVIVFFISSFFQLHSEQKETFFSQLTNLMADRLDFETRALQVAAKRKGYLIQEDLNRLNLTQAERNYLVQIMNFLVQNLQTSSPLNFHLMQSVLQDSTQVLLLLRKVLPFPAEIQTGGVLDALDAIFVHLPATHMIPFDDAKQEQIQKIQEALALFLRRTDISLKNKLQMIKKTKQAIKYILHQKYEFPCVRTWRRQAVPYLQEAKKILDLQEKYAPGDSGKQVFEQVHTENLKEWQMNRNIFQTGDKLEKIDFLIKQKNQQEAELRNQEPGLLNNEYELICKAVEILEMPLNEDELKRSSPDSLSQMTEKQYRQLSIKWHPDKNSGNEYEATEKQKALNAAIKLFREGISVEQIEHAFAEKKIALVKDLELTKEEIANYAKDFRNIDYRMQIKYCSHKQTTDLEKVRGRMIDITAGYLESTDLLKEYIYQKKIAQKSREVEDAFRTVGFHPKQSGMHEPNFLDHVSQSSGNLVENYTNGLITFENLIAKLKIIADAKSKLDQASEFIDGIEKKLAQLRAEKGAILQEERDFLTHKLGLPQNLQEDILVELADKKLNDASQEPDCKKKDSAQPSVAMKEIAYH